MNIIKTNLRTGKTEKFAADNGNVIASIARSNGFLTDTSVKENLRAGHTIYTSFNKYRREG